MCSCILFALSISTLSILIRDVLYAQSDDSNIPAISIIVIMLALLCCVLFCCLVCIVFLFFYREHDLLGKRNCCKQAFSKVVLGYGEEREYSTDF